MTAKQALMRAVDMSQTAESNGVFDRTGHEHYVVWSYNGRPTMHTTNPIGNPFSDTLGPYRFEDMTND